MSDTDKSGAGRYAFGDRPRFAGLAPAELNLRQPIDQEAGILLDGRQLLEVRLQLGLEWRVAWIHASPHSRPLTSMLHPSGDW